MKDKYYFFPKGEKYKVFNHKWTEVIFGIALFPSIVKVPLFFSRSGQHIKDMNVESWHSRAQRV